MQFRLLLAGAGLLLLAALFMHLHSPAVESRSLTLRILGAVGQRFTGSYTVDGAIHVVNASVPATLELRTTDLAYEIQPEAGGGPGEFRVNLEVEKHLRVSTLGHQGQSVRGGYHLTSQNETAW